MKIKSILPFFLFLALVGNAGAYENLSLNIGGGYAGNLFADSFNIGNSYLVNNVTASSTNFNKVKLKLYYGISYYEYDTDNGINNFLHIPGFALYKRSIGSKFKWGVEAFASIKDYIAANSHFDNFKIIGMADASYYVRPGLQLVSIYKLTRSRYIKYRNLDNYEHWLDGETVLTLQSRTTIRGAGRYVVRRFDEDKITFHWIDTELGASQSLGLKTGLGFTFLRRWSKGGERPLSSYYIISGITSYWDPWDGNQMDISIKRILPLAIVFKIDGSYWQRNFTYDETMQRALPWLDGKSGREDHGWLVRGDINRQFNLRAMAFKSFKITLRAGYFDNRSDDRFYRYHNFMLDTNLEINII